MNRKDRRRMSKKLGIMQFQQKMPLDKRLKLMQENIEIGKKTHAENVERVRIEQAQGNDELITSQISSLAIKISAAENIPLIDAIEKAKKQIYEETKQ